jgi:hypothetical protein
VSFALAIPHTPWRPERVETFQRLRDALGVHDDVALPEHVFEARAFTERAPNHVWSEAMWKWGTRQGASHFVQLQDDVIPAPDFWSALRAMVEAVPDEVIGLEVAAPAARALFAEGHHWCTTADGLIGVGYVIPVALLRDFLEWRETRLKSGAVQAVSEDTLIGLWCITTGRRIWHPIPTVIDHDTSIASTYGNDHHPHRRPVVTWDVLDKPADLAAVEWWLDTPSQVPHLGRFYDSTPALAAQWVEGVDERARARFIRDDGRREMRRIAHAARALAKGRESAVRIIVCTPTLGGIHPAHASTISRLMLAEAVDVDLGFELLGTWRWAGDLVKVRSRFVRAFLETDATHLLFLDSDVSCEPAAVFGMLAADRDFIACPYPKRSGINFEAVMRDDGRPPEARAYSWKLRLLEGPEGRHVDERGCTEVAGVPLGCALLSRRCLEQMTAHYRADLEFDDVIPPDPTKHPTVALFQLILRDRNLFGEDYSFCARWRAMGGRVWLYLGHGSPVTHYGEHAFRGIVETFGVTRVPATAK